MQGGVACNLSIAPSNNIIRPLLIKPLSTPALPIS